ncbi:ATP-binding protein [Nonomuraea sp. NPDC046802]|uniref:ATP-binding protein n=1 Tax=Nonomuraea sp. NPDC046802 TaxID=3154919 RepID=UPI0033E3E16D
MFLIEQIDHGLIPAKARITITNWVGADHARVWELQTVASELVTNAIRYGIGPEAGWVRMRLSSEPGNFHFTVTDPGRSEHFPQIRKADDSSSPDIDPGPEVERFRGLRVVHEITGGFWGHYVNSFHERVVWALIPR